MNNIGLNTDNYYKFICTLSLIASIYFFSFDTLYLEPYNSKMTDINIQTAELASEIGYLKGLSLDFNQLVKDSIKNGYVEYFYFSKNDTIEKIKYYSNFNTSKRIKLIVDSLNKINRQYSKAVFKEKAISDTKRIIEKNNRIKQSIFVILGIISSLIFFYSLRKWYIYRKDIDK